jgi:ribonuclease P protein component
LRRRADFQHAYRSGARARGRHVVLFLRIRSEPPDHPRVGVTASRRVGTAVRRSRCKRRLRELLRAAAERLGTRRVDLVANARASCATAPWRELELDFGRCLEQLLRDAERP